MSSRNKINISLLLVIALLVLFSSFADAQNTSSPRRPSAIGKTSASEDTDQGKLADAVSTLFGILSRTQRGDTGAVKAEELYNKGIELERAGKMREALQNYEASLNLRYEDPRVHLGIGRIIENENPALSLYHYQSALRFGIEAVSDKAPALEMLRRFLVGRYLQYAIPVDANDPEVSVNLLELAVSLAPEDPRIHAHLATAYYFVGKYDRSIQESRNALVLGMDDAIIFSNIAAAYAKLKRADEAESYLLEALNRDDQDINDVLNSIRKSEEIDTLAAFSKLFGKDRLEKIMKNSVKGLLEDGIKKWQSGDREGGMESVQNAIEAYPNHSHSLIVLGDFKRSSGDTAGSIEAYKKAMERNPNNQLALPRLGDITYAAGDYITAANYYKQAIDLMSGRIERVDILDRTAVALAQQGKHDEALDLLDKWLKANPDAPEYFELSVRRAGILSDASRHKDAETVIRALIEKDKLNPASYVVLYTFYKERNDERNAAKAINDGIIRIQAAMDKDPLDPINYRSLARLYRTIGKEREARQQLLNGGLRTAEKRFFSNELFASDADTEAFEVLKSWIVSEPRNAEAVLSYCWVAAKLSKELPQAMARLNQVAELYGSEELLPFRRTKGYLLFAMNEYAKAIEEFKAVLTSDDVAQAGFFHRLWGASAEALNRKPEAIEHYKKALALDREGNLDIEGRVAALEGNVSSENSR